MYWDRGVYDEGSLDAKVGREEDEPFLHAGGGQSKIVICLVHQGMVHRRDGKVGGARMAGHWPDEPKTKNYAKGE